MKNLTNVTESYAAHLRSFLTGGPDSERIEFNDDFYKEEFDLLGPQFKLDIRAPFGPKLLAPEMAALTIIEIKHEDIDENLAPDLQDVYVSVGSRAIDQFVLLGNIVTLDVDGMSFKPVNGVSQGNLREAARLSIQNFQVYSHFRETGEITTHFPDTGGMF